MVKSIVVVTHLSCNPFRIFTSCHPQSRGGMPRLIGTARFQQRFLQRRIPYPLRYIAMLNGLPRELVNTKVLEVLMPLLALQRFKDRRRHFHITITFGVLVVVRPLERWFHESKSDDWQNRRISIAKHRSQRYAAQQRTEQCSSRGSHCVPWPETSHVPARKARRRSYIP